jgi:hypothetical protein
MPDLGDEIIRIPALRRPTLPELQKKFPWVQKIQEDTSPECEVILDLGTFLDEGEVCISEDEHARRRSFSDGLLGYQQFVWLVEHQDDYLALKALFRKIYIDGPGIIVANRDGGQYFPCLPQVGKRFRLCWYWTGLDLQQYGRVARSRKW